MLNDILYIIAMVCGFNVVGLLGVFFWILIEEKLKPAPPPKKKMQREPEDMRDLLDSCYDMNDWGDN